MNTGLPLIILVVSYAAHSAKIDQFLARMKEAIGQMEMTKILKIIP